MESSWEQNNKDSAVQELKVEGQKGRNRDRKGTEKGENRKISKW